MMVDFQLEGIVEFEPIHERGICIIPLINHGVFGLDLKRKYLTELGESEQAKELKAAAESTNRIAIATESRPSIKRKDLVTANYVLNKSNNSHWLYNLVSVDLRTIKHPHTIYVTFYDSKRAPEQEQK